MRIVLNNYKSPIFDQLSHAPKSLNSLKIYACELNCASLRRTSCAAMYTYVCGCAAAPRLGRAWATHP